MLELMHMEQTKSSIAWKIKIHSSLFAVLFTKRCEFWEAGVGGWQSMQDSFFFFFSVLVNKWFLG